MLVVSSIWISLSAPAFQALACMVYDVPFQPVAGLIAFLCAFFCCSRDKVSGSKEDLINSPARAILARYPIGQLANVAYLLAILITILYDWHKLPFVLVFGLVGWFYAQKVFGRRPKDVTGVKSLLVAGACSICFAGLIGVGYGLIFLMALINTILFDVRDVRGDIANGVRTLPVALGASRTVAGLVILNVALAFYSLPAAAIGSVLLYYFRKPRTALEYDLWIDGWPLWTVLCYCIEKSLYSL